MGQSPYEPDSRPSSALGSHGQYTETMANEELAQEPHYQQQGQQRQQQQQQFEQTFQKGCLSSLAVIPTIRNATEYSRATKWALTILVALAALSAPLGTNILLRESHWKTNKTSRGSIEVVRGLVSSQKQIRFSRIY